MNYTSALINEFYDCFKNSHIWLILSFTEIKSRYRRTVIGPFWLTLGTATTILGMGFVWSSLFGMNVQDFLPYFATGMVIWIYIASILNEGCSVFTSQAALIHNVKMSYFIHVMTMISRNVIILFHNMLVVIIVFIICGQKINLNILWFIPGILLLILNSFWISILIGVFATRFRDVASMIANLTTLIMFVTPVMWKAEMLQEKRRFIATLNPFTHMIGIVRDPLLSQSPSLESYCIVTGVLFLGFTLSLWLYKKYVHRVVFWM